jgi:hypothetical protein
MLSPTDLHYQYKPAADVFHSTSVLPALKIYELE